MGYLQQSILHCLCIHSVYSYVFYTYESVTNSRHPVLQSVYTQRTIHGLFATKYFTLSVYSYVFYTVKGLCSARACRHKGAGTHTRTRRHVYTHTHTRKNARTYTHRHTQTHKHTHTDSPTPTNLQPPKSSIPTHSNAHS